MSSKNTIKYLGKDKRRNIEIAIKSFDPERDFKMICFCHALISNIINLRKRYFFKRKDKAKAYYFNKADLKSLNKPEFTLVKLTSTILWKKTKNKYKKPKIIESGKQNNY